MLEDQIVFSTIFDCFFVVLTNTEIQSALFNIQLTVDNLIVDAPLSTIQ